MDIRLRLLHQPYADRHVRPDALHAGNEIALKEMRR